MKWECYHLSVCEEKQKRIKKLKRDKFRQWKEPFQGVQEAKDERASFSNLYPLMEARNCWERCVVCSLVTMSQSVPITLAPETVPTVRTAVCPWLRKGTFLETSLTSLSRGFSIVFDIFWGSQRCGEISSCSPFNRSYEIINKFLTFLHERISSWNWFEQLSFFFFFTGSRSTYYRRKLSSSRDSLN